MRRFIGVFCSGVLGCSSASVIDIEDGATIAVARVFKGSVSSVEWATGATTWELDEERALLLVSVPHDAYLDERLEPIGDATQTIHPRLARTQGRSGFGGCRRCLVPDAGSPGLMPPGASCAPAAYLPTNWVELVDGRTVERDLTPEEKSLLSDLRFDFSGDCSFDEPSMDDPWKRVEILGAEDTRYFEINVIDDEGNWMSVAEGLSLSSKAHATPVFTETQFGEPSVGALRPGHPGHWLAIDHSSGPGRLLELTVGSQGLDVRPIVEDVGLIVRSFAISGDRAVLGGGVLNGPSSSLVPTLSECSLDTGECVQSSPGAPCTRGSLTLMDETVGVTATGRLIAKLDDGWSCSGSLPESIESQEGTIIPDGVQSHLRVGDEVILCISALNGAAKGAFLTSVRLDELRAAARADAEAPFRGEVYREGTFCRDLYAANDRHGLLAQLQTGDGQYRILELSPEMEVIREYRTIAQAEGLYPELSRKAGLLSEAGNRSIVRTYEGALWVRTSTSWTRVFGPEIESPSTTATARAESGDLLGIAGDQLTRVDADGEKTTLSLQGVPGTAVAMTRRFEDVLHVAGRPNWFGELDPQSGELRPMADPPELITAIERLAGGWSLVLGASGKLWAYDGSHFVEPKIVAHGPRGEVGPEHPEFVAISTQGGVGWGGGDGFLARVTAAAGAPSVETYWLAAVDHQFSWSEREVSEPLDVEAVSVTAPDVVDLVLRVHFRPMVDTLGDVTRAIVTLQDSPGCRPQSPFPLALCSLSEPEVITLSSRDLAGLSHRLLLRNVLSKGEGRVARWPFGPMTSVAGYGDRYVIGGPAGRLSELRFRR